MKKSDLLHALLACLLTALLSVSAVFCLQSAYHFPAAQWQIAGLCLLFSAASVLLSNRRGWWLLVALLLPAGRQLWELGFAQHAEAVLWHISVMLDKVYDIGYVIWWTADDHSGCDTTAFFMALGMLLSMVVGCSLVHRKSLGAILVGVLALVPCLLITDLAPKPVWLLILLGVLLTLYLTRHVQRTDADHSNGFLLRGGVCIALVLCLLVAFLPPDTYTPREDLQLQQWLERLEELLRPTEPPVVIGPTAPSGSTEPTYTWPGGINPSSRVNLKKVGAKAFSPQISLSIIAQESGWLYLRQAGYDTYAGTNWYVDVKEEEFYVNSTYLEAVEQTVQIQLHYANRSMCYVPYYVESVSLQDGRVPCPEMLERYSYTYRPLRQDWLQLWQQNHGGPISGQQWGVDEAYLQLPEQTRAGVAQYLQQLQITADTDVAEAVRRIENFVRGSAEYSLMTQRMPVGEEDFALWFLEESDTGYCVHFSSAAAVLLRAAGIPARYVEGYLAEAVAGENCMVYAGNAHAWVEYYLPGLGWTVLDATPGNGATPDPEPTTRPTLPTEPEPTTQPSEPTASTPPATAPTEPSVPATEPVSGGKNPPDLQKFLPFLWGAMQVLVVLVLLWLQWRLRLLWLEHRLHKGDPNTQALARWRHTKWLARLRKEPAPNGLLQLANKAKFSQHALTHRELRQFELYRMETVSLLQKRHWLARLVYRLVLAVY